jgi:hypothetical protein
VFLSGVGRFLCEGFQYDCEYHFEKAWLGEAGKRLLLIPRENCFGEKLPTKVSVITAQRMENAIQAG